MGHRTSTFAFVVVGLMVAGALTACGGGSPQPPPSTGTASTSSGTERSVPIGGQGAGAPSGVINDAVADSWCQFKVTAVTHTRTIRDPSDGTVHTAKGEYTVLHVLVSNSGDKFLTLEPSWQKVYDAAGHEFAADEAATLATGPNGKNPIFETVVSVAKTVDGDIVFDLPAGDTAVRASLHENPLSFGATVSLKPTPS